MQPNSYVDIRPPRRVTVDTLLGEKDKFHSAMAAEVPPELSLTTKEKFTKAKGVVGNRLAELGDGVPNVGDELVVVPLGTNSAISSRFRNGDYYSSVTLLSAIDLQTSFRSINSNTGLGLPPTRCRRRNVGADGKILRNRPIATFKRLAGIAQVEVYLH